MKQKFQNEDLAAKKAIVPDHTLWGKVGLNNLGNTCYMSAAIHVSQNCLVSSILHVFSFVFLHQNSPSA